MTLDIIELAHARAYPPRVSEFTQPFWQGLAEGRWQTTRCTQCSRFTFPPKPICPHCWSKDMAWEAFATEGELYSWTRVHAPPAVFAGEAPYSLGIIDLDGGLRIAVRLLDPDSGTYAPGMRMRMVALRYQDGPLFAARPA
ncbi:Zn-ribbon domain-containing OB-fold protein [Verticiella sediminum]|uniref:Zn-ribbon domain-containing OB-fold protein n=1 Tax=Verticiella sediminum TaxID=1247510 RepID=A0A556AJL5_9BURK|nr:Zn-ribbon domain-containing OB-fold protein [Verticiella sediminum]TSH93071.1 Zn-ribbon domain-containing OB-fold protein [Verticiella sediminum]